MDLMLEAFVALERIQRYLLQRYELSFNDERIFSEMF